MNGWNRRDWMKALGGGALGTGVAAAVPLAAAARASDASGPEPPATGEGGALALADFQPRSMLHVKETKVASPRFPVVDVHTHLSFTKSEKKGVSVGEEVVRLVTAKDAVAVMDRKGIKTLVNLTGGSGRGLEATLAAFDRAAPGRFLTCTEPIYGQLLDPRYPQLQADAIASAHAAGARGLKITKTLGLYLRERIDEGPLVKVDDRRFDPMWEASAAHGFPVFVHIADPEAFFLPTDRFNERWDELGHHPDWSFHGRDFPSFKELMDARDRVFARHPKTQFVALHVGHDAENLAFVGESLDRFPNMTVELGARIGELGRQPRTARRFFDRHQDRILFGTDAVPPPAGESTPQQVFKDALYEIYYRFLETEDEYFDYAPAPVPPQGRWCIYGLGLPDPILKKVYHENAERLLRLPA
ncbi:MAG TPA: amidohydrolase family protein [Vicinamibacteria bacterium]|nr:amidohydrolase family protein [Vicinamibacteria bacterium]